MDRVAAGTSGFTAAINIAGQSRGTCSDSGTLSLNQQAFVILGNPLVGNTLTLSFSGQDTAGDTCRFTGSLTATR